MKEYLLSGVHGVGLVLTPPLHAWDECRIACGSLRYVDLEISSFSDKALYRQKRINILCLIEIDLPTMPVFSIDFLAANPNRCTRAFSILTLTVFQLTLCS
ncbi:hypothetical protein EJ05DRAFT_476521 [Pseudovirgaria hyperparasitica]|uniref:Uncharacterized protein n=1 Tax=Pseudovirgaria hyperparasitica TaxID=470096 RepID=A0A6A6W8P6_9PEZI|nr:uncharacterized protein EJ05DRAFT_476521 [Pseudovirgaria hyperparasitica]KAF2758266.1 hypothetical protein EJ05DRAFT_476521 [Pseudovirgaria hyperparasitica]